jgi:polyhydroxyalkanoate synthesis repressor PhaR
MDNKAVRTIKRYSNRKLYDTDRSCYVTLEDIAKLIREGEDVQIIDNKSKDDLTSITLTQIIFEQEKKKKRILPLPTLRNIIQSGGDFFHDNVSQPLKTVKDTTEKRIESIVAGAGEKTGEFKSSFNEMVDQSQKNIDDLQTRLEEGLKSISHKVVLSPGQKEITDLRARIDRLEEKLRETAA